jgi:hypothetical protein
MKRLIAAVSLSILATPAFSEAGMPFDQLERDRALPNVQERADTATVYPFGGSAPHDELSVDRALPDIPEPSTQFASAPGETRSDVEITGAAAVASPWENDYHFIAPAQ